MNASLPLPRVLAYGGLGLPLAFAALPLYVHLAPFYSGRISLSLLGVLLLALRFFDASIDPLIGTLFDRFPRPRLLIALALPLLGLGWIGVFSPPDSEYIALWLAAMLALATAGYSLASVVHNAWGARLTDAPHERTRLYAAREGAGLVGVLLASALPFVLADTLAQGLQRLGWIFIALLLVFGAWTLIATPAAPAARRVTRLALFLRPLRNRAFARFLPGYLLNGVAAALPATLVIFFVADVLKLESQSGVFLALYFLAGAAGLPLWVAFARRVGKLDAWLAAMALSIVAFVSAFFLGAGDFAGFALVCVASGLALGADLALPPALVADFLADDPEPQPGATYGLPGFFAKLALALAAGLALPLLDAFDYQPGGDNLAALAFAYALLPCLLKLLAVGWFWCYRDTLRTQPCPLPA